jgi:ketosteroid isomerase-like protein
MGSFDQAVEDYHRRLRKFMKGDPGPVTQMFSEREDVVLCNPFLPFAHGPAEVAETIRRAASHFTEGTVEFERVATYTTADLGYTVEVERFAGLVDGNQGSGALRVTMIFRIEDSDWKVAHRHADPITTPQATESILGR